ncbi:hypothetical protein Leryth_015877 [Lithospermum erythrorhizon]|nr:hypothetical protein Leryth_015877 [Lithospermum erythrorhizon]
MISSTMVKVVIFSFMLIGVAIAGAPPKGANTCPVPVGQCANACNKRCSNTQYKNACLEFCNKCCQGCQCVPPGTYGNKTCCDCYNNWKTQQGGPKCP